MLDIKVSYSGACVPVQKLRAKLYKSRNYIADESESLAVNGEIVVSVWHKNTVLSSCAIFESKHVPIFDSVACSEHPYFMGRLVAHSRTIDTTPALMVALFETCLSNGIGTLLGASDIDMHAALYNKFPFLKRYGPNCVYLGSEVIPNVVDTYGGFQIYTDISARQGTMVRRRAYCRNG